MAEVDQPNISKPFDPLVWYLADAAMHGAGWGFGTGYGGYEGYVNGYGMKDRYDNGYGAAAGNGRRSYSGTGNYLGNAYGCGYAFNYDTAIGNGCGNGYGYERLRHALCF